MEFSLLLMRNAIETYAGGLISRFRVRSRRSVLFFEDILAEYVKECDDSGHGRKIMDAIEEAGALMTASLIPGFMRPISPTLIINVAGRTIWRSIGALDDIKLEINGDRCTVSMKNEVIDRVIGGNSFVAGSWKGTCMVLLGKEMEYDGVAPRDGWNRYEYRITDIPELPLPSKPKEQYDAMNRYIPTEGLTLKDAIMNGVFNVKGNSVYFRGRRLCYFENTYYHLLGIKGPMLEKVQDIAKAYFDGLIEKDATETERLKLLKTLLQSMGWGFVAIEIKPDGNVRIVIDSPPVGLQMKDDYSFLANTIAGYMKVIDDRFEMESVAYGERKLSLDFVR